ncbi:MAG: ATP-dependent DNA helicase RecG [Ruminococcaceae bacterium]|nr:ATP-dependent DNA helicase RecG [Oscillospiraceae bacterium]
MNFSTDIRYIKGVGSVRAESFKKLSVDTVGALLRYYPRTYEDWSRVYSVKEAPLNENCCIKAIVSDTPTSVRIPGGRTLSKTSVTDGIGLMNMTFFNNKYIKNMLKEGEEYYFFGKVTLNRYGAREMTSPVFRKAASDARIVPVYPQSNTLTSKQIEKVVKTALDEIATVPEYLPDTIIRENSLCSLDFAIRNIHFPADYASLERARNRLIFDELFALQLGLLSIKNRTRTLSGCVIKNDCSGEFISTLPFEMTNAQKRAVREALSDMQKNEPMNRLLQGDVGSGKTAVAAALIYTVVKNGYQCAMMAPTEVLAEQHIRTFEKLLRDTGISAVLLTGSTKAAEKKIIKEKLKSGEISLAIGTHALIQEDVEFGNLGLVITDEQHRFGVAQRTSLSEKGRNPHIYVMSATPIPRTLAMILYGDLNVSVLDELPPGRQSVDTYCVGRDYHERIYKFIKKHLDAGSQGYIVCPLVEEGESDIVPAEELYGLLSQSEFASYRVGLLHGRMKPKDKDEVMRSFAAGNIDLLISTVVIEVGVDVPNATVMVIENAERFGLSQLHQLRGRIGRGSEKSTCILVSDAQNEEAKTRFDIMCRTSDGFKIADADLKLRGPGDFFGKRQHGLPRLALADILTDTELLMKAQRAANKVIEDDRYLESEKNRKLRRQVETLFADNYGV